MLSDGHIIHDKYIGISQSLEVNKHKCGRIKSRLNILRADYKEHIATREYNGKPYRMMNLTIKGWVADKFLEIFPLKNIPGDIMDWSDRALGALLRGFIGGDGHKRDDGRTVIVQKDYDRISMLQAIAVKLGYTARLTRRKGGTWNLFLTNRTYRGLRGTNGKGTTITKELYSGIVWCPQTPLNTFVARRNGSVFITGNTFPPALVEPCIKAATSEHGCCPACGSGWARVVERNRMTRPELPKDDPRYRPGRYEGKLTAIKGEMGDAGYTDTTTLGWRATCSCGRDDVIPSIVLDPFCGSGTTLLVARKLGRRAVGVDLSLPYLRDQARSRLGLDKLAAWRDGGKEVETKLSGLPIFEEMRK